MSRLDFSDAPGRRARFFAEAMTRVMSGDFIGAHWSLWAAGLTEVPPWASSMREVEE